MKIEQIVKKRMYWVDDNNEVRTTVSNNIKEYIHLLSIRLSTMSKQVAIMEYAGFEIGITPVYEHDLISIDNSIYEVVYHENRLVLKSAVDIMEIPDFLKYQRLYKIHLLNQKPGNVLRRSNQSN